MANYKYRCLDCGDVFGVEATIQEKEEAVGEKFTCSQCHSTNTKSEFSAGNFIKNIFISDSKAGGCCSDGDTCGTSIKPSENKKNCGNGNNNGSCCG